MTRGSSDPSWFAPAADYTLAQRCPRCGADPWVECTAPRKAKAQNPDHRQHTDRQDAGRRHYNQDICNAPWFEDRVPGKCYSTLPKRPA